MKLSYTTEDVERWRDKSHRRTPAHLVRTERQVLSFVDSVGFCLASKADDIELPNLWNALASSRPASGTLSASSDRKYYLSYAWEIQTILPNHNSIFYGKVFRRRPCLISKEYLPYFYALSERTGTKDEYKTEHASGRLSSGAKQVMDLLMKRSPLTVRELKTALYGTGKKTGNGVEKAIEELHRKMFITRILGNGHQFGAAWAPVTKVFPNEVRKAKTITAEQARFKLLTKYFENQLISSIETIHKVFGWSKREIYQTIGKLINEGVITPLVAIDGETGKYYCFIH